jgi:hypothetical protein
MTKYVKVSLQIQKNEISPISSLLNAHHVHGSCNTGKNVHENFSSVFYISVRY